MMLCLTSIGFIANAQVSVDDDYFPAFVVAQNAVKHEQDSIDLAKNVKPKITNKVIEVAVAKVEEPKKVIQVIEPNVIQVEVPKKVVQVVAPKVIQVESPPVVQVIETPKKSEPKKEKYLPEDYADGGISIFSEGQLVGIKFTSLKRDKKYFLVKFVKKNTAISNLTKNGDYFTGSYLVPSVWWNMNIDSSPTYEQLEYIKDNFKIYE